MKTTTLYITFILSLLSIQVQAQNVPDGAIYPSGTATRSITLPQAYSSTTNGITYTSPFNYTRNWIPIKPITTSSTMTFGTGLNTSPVSTSYSDGWGHPMMSIFHSVASSYKDRVSVYDNRGSLTSNSFLSYTLTHNQKMSGHLNPFSEQQSYYSTQYPYEGNAAYSQSVTSYPSDVPTNVTYSSGLSFVAQGRGTTTTATFNNSTDVKIYEVTGASSTLTGYSSPTYYGPNTLSVKVTTGQHGDIIKEFYNKKNELICKKVYAGVDAASHDIWLTTNYVYDNTGLLVYILTPKAADLTTSACLNYAYSYKYNKYRNQIETTTPGKTGATYTVYDIKQRPVLVQTPLMRSTNKWQFAVYDSRNRVIMSGLITSTANRTTWQDWMDGVTTPSPPSVASAVTYLNHDFDGNYSAAISPIAEIRTYNYYDEYPSFSGFTGSFDNSYSASYLTYGSTFVVSPAVTPVPYMFTQGMLTASKVKVIDPTSSFPNNWIMSMFFYDQKGEMIQTQTLNPWNTSALDVTTNQYDFSGQRILDITHHNSWSSCAKTSTTIQNKYTYDNYNNRITTVEQKIDGGAWITLAYNQYDDLGRLSIKTIGGVETQNYKYNIRGQLESINKTFVNASASTVDNTFGALLNYDWGFSDKRYDGKVSGIVWREAGISNENRAYGYHYDQAGRITAADFNKMDISPFHSGWYHTTVDMSMSNVKYDNNGNIVSMNQKGTPVASAPVDIDLLTYGYNDKDQLGYVADAVTTNYGIGDFQDVSTSCTVMNNGFPITVPCDDYTYDNDGNLTSDKNKQIYSITYNEMDQPLVITFGTSGSTTGTITNTYDAAGNLLKKIINNSSTTDEYNYWGPLTYFNGDLQYVLHSEGRANWQAATSDFQYDYFIKDHLGNVRTVVTSNYSTLPVEYFADHEIASAHLEHSIFANIDSVRDLKPGSVNPYDVEAAHLNGSDSNKRIGTAILLQVMSGDKFDVSADGYWEEDTAGMSHAADGYTMMNSILGTLVGGDGGFANSEAGANTVSDLFTSANYEDVYEHIIDSLTDYTRPRAYINYIVFDNQMHIVPEQSGVIQIANDAGTWQTVGTAAPVNILQNGYLAVYISDESHMDVDWDKLSIYHYRGNLMQEQHYYPFGLAVNEGTAPGAVPNKYLYQTKKYQDELGLNWYDFTARQYDPQVGRFWGIDPANQFPSGYTGQGNDPANNVDPTGMIANSSVTQTNSRNVDINEGDRGYTEDFSPGDDRFDGEHMDDAAWAWSVAKQGESDNPDAGKNDKKNDKDKDDDNDDDKNNNTTNTTANTDPCKTWDPVTDQRISELDPRVQDPARDFINYVEVETGVQLRIVQGMRTFDEQNALYAQGRTSVGPNATKDKPLGSIVTNAKGGQSYHNFGLAIDVVIMKHGKPVWNRIPTNIGAMGIRHGFEWGANWNRIKDYPHFQMTFGLKL